MAEHSQQFIYFLRAKRLEMLTKGPTSEEARVQMEHGKYLEELSARRIVILAGALATTMIPLSASWS